MKKEAVFLGMAVILSHATGFAGTEGHGGEVVVCPGKAPVFYDVYEAKTIRDLDLNLGSSDLSAAQKVKLALDRYAKRDPEHAQKYQGWVDSFLTEAKIGDFDVAPINDADHIALPPGCTVIQLIDQRVPEMDGDKRYFISQSLWEKLDTDQMAAAILHEIIYREAIAYGQKESAGVRAVNSYLLSGRIATLTDKAYYQLLLHTGLITEASNSTDDERPIHLNGISVDVGWCSGCSVAFYDDGHLKVAGEISENVMVKIGASQFPLLNMYDQVEFYDGGSLKGVATLEPRAFEFHGQKIMIQGGSDWSGGDRDFNIQFDEQGNLIVCQLSQPASFRVQGHVITFAINNVSFYPDGSIRSGFFDVEQNLKNTHGKMVKVKSKDYLSPVLFDRNGLVENF